MNYKIIERFPWWVRFPAIFLILVAPELVGAGIWILLAVTVIWALGGQV